MKLTTQFCKNERGKRQSRERCTLTDFNKEDKVKKLNVPRYKRQAREGDKPIQRKSKINVKRYEDW